MQDREKTGSSSGQSFSCSGPEIGGYRLGQEIGSGGTGTVYLARSGTDNRLCALKVLSGEIIPDRNAAEHFLKTAHRFISFQHPNFVTVLDAGYSKGVCYLVSEYVRGKTLKQVLNDCRVLTPDVILRMMTEAASAIDALWKEKGLLHGDVKPDNMLIDPEGHLHLLDIQISGPLSSGETLGTPQYISPEALIRNTRDLRSDLYSLGASFYQAASGEFPFPGKDIREILEKQLKEDPVPPRTLNPDIPERLERILLKLLRKDPQARYGSAGELLRELETITRKLEHRHAVQEKTADFIMRSESEQSREVETMREQHEARNRKLFFGIVLAVLTGILVMVGVIRWLVFFPVVTDNDFDRRLAELRNRKGKPHDPLPEKEEKTGVYEGNVHAILAYASRNPAETARILEQCDSFFRRFPDPVGKREEEAFAKLQNLYAPLDEVRCETARQTLRKTGHP